MSRGRYYLMWTMLADLTGLALSYLYGAWLLPSIGQLLPAPPGFVRTVARWLFTHSLEVLPVPHPLQEVFLHHTGLTWLALSVLVHLGYLLISLHRRMRTADLGKPYVGGDAWGIVGHRFEEYAEAIKRWLPAFSLKTPTWRYYRRQHGGQPALFWRGRTLVIEHDLLRRDRLHELRPLLARELLFYNSEDAALMDILAWYPRRLSRWLLLWHLLGCGILLPAMMTRWLLWPRYWRHRTLVADRFAYLLWQGYPLYQLLHGQVQRYERLIVEQQIAELEQWLREDERTNVTYGSHLPTISGLGFQDGNGPADQSLLLRLQYEQRLADLRQRQVQLWQYERQVLNIHPLIEERREQLAALLSQEQSWLEQRGISTRAAGMEIPAVQEVSRQIPQSR